MAPRGGLKLPPLDREMSLSAAARALGVSHKTVMRWYAYERLPWRRFGAFEGRALKLRDLLAAPLFTVAGVGRLLGLSARQVRARLAKAGIESSGPPHAARKRYTLADVLRLAGAEAGRRGR